MLYFPLRPAAKIVGVWTAMEKTDQKNGCLYVVPGSHKGALYEHETVIEISNNTSSLKLSIIR